MRWWTLRVLVTGHEGYIGSELVPQLRSRGHEVLGVDTGYFRLGAQDPTGVPARQMDIRDLQHQHLHGVTAVVHLAGLSNDPMSYAHREATWDINNAATVRLAELARVAGVERFVFASTCSVYGAADTEHEVTETSATNPLTPYAETKLLAETQVAKLADAWFTPTALRFATVYGYSPMFRTDLVVNNLVVAGLSTGEVRLHSAGLVWRPLIHVRDVARAFAGVLEAPRETVCGESFNAGPPGGNHRVVDIAQEVARAIPGSRVSSPDDPPVDHRSYRVSFAKLARALPDVTCQMTSLPDGVADTVDAVTKAPEEQDWFSPRRVRLARLRELVEAGELTELLRYR